MTRGTARRHFLATLAGVPLLAACGKSKPFAAIGERFPDFSLVDIDGRPHDRTAYAGRPLAVNFWATWCPPCRAEMPDLEQTRRQHADRGLQVLGISIDEDPNPVREFRLRIPVEFPLLLDTDRQLTNALGVFSFPTTFLVSRQGLVTEVLVGPRPWPDYPGIAALLA